MDSLHNSLFLMELPAEIRRCVFESFFTEAVVFDADEHIHPHRLQLERKDLLNLSLTCKQIYAESIPLLYSQPCFTFRNPLALCLLAESMQQQHLESITTIHIDTIDQRKSYPEETFRRWLQACEILAKLPRLQRLSVKVSSDRHSPANHRLKKRDKWPWESRRGWVPARCDPRWRAVFDPLMLISTPIDFDVYVPWMSPFLKDPTPLDPILISFKAPTPFRVWCGGQRVQ